MSAIFPATQVIVVGGGLAGFSAANTVLENGGNVIVLDKMPLCGGNSCKATSGINGSETATQKALGIQDSNELFFKDTLRGGAKKHDLARVMCYNSGAAVDWLQQKFDLDLSLLAQLGGHSAKRTHRGGERFPGMTITFALMEMCERVQEKDHTRCRVVNKARVNKLLTDASGKIVGCEYVKDDKTYREYGPVILCTGGFGADFSKDSLLAKYRSDLMNLPTTNGEHCTGDGIKMGESVGVKTIDMEFVQVHPTGLVKPEDPDAKIKFLAAEALRGEGGILLDANGKRFANELGRRDYVTGQMWKNKGPFRLVLNTKASEAIKWHCEHYKGRGIMKRFNNATELAAEMKINKSVLDETFAEYNAAAVKMKADEAEINKTAPYDAYPEGKSFDKFGKKFFHNTPVTSEEVLHVAIVTPVIHYCMGGLEVNESAQCLNKSLKPIPGLYAAGEVAGGKHGDNRLGGNSLMDCVVFGRIAGAHSAEYILGKSGLVPTSLKSIAAPKAAAPAPAAPAAAAPAAAPAAAASGPQMINGMKVYTVADVAKHNTKNDCWVILDGKVLDVTKFLPEHPGGELAILTFAGKDATHEFNMIHPPNVVQKYAPNAVIGVVGSGAHAAAAAAPAQNGHSAAPAQVIPPGMKAYTVAEVAKHNTKNDCWVILDGKVLNVTKFLPDHPGGELAILTFAGKDATHEFNMIHPPNVVQKYAPDCVIGVVDKGTGAAAPAAGQPAAAASGATGGLVQPLLTSGNSSASAEHWWGEARNTSKEFGPFGPSVCSFISTIWELITLFFVEICSTIFLVRNYKIPHDKSGLTRSATFLIFFVFVHGLGNLHVFAGPDAFQGYTFFLNRPMPWGTLALPVEIYLLVAAVMHVAVGLLRTYKYKSLKMLSSENDRKQLTLAISGVWLLVFLVIHMQQFRLATDYTEYSFRYKWMYPFYCERNDLSCPVGTFKDLYRLEMLLFQDMKWVLFYIGSVYMFVVHLSEGFCKIVNSSAYVPKVHKSKARLIAICATYFIGLCYSLFPVYCYLFPVKDWSAYEKAHVTSWKGLVGGPQ